MIETCRHHGLTEFGGNKKGSRYCKKCNVERQLRRRKAYRSEFIASSGGCCQVCGYDRYTGALQFHHIDPTTKEFMISSGSMTSKARMLAEVEKCVLLCGNCHAEVEAGVTPCPPRNR